LFSFVLIRYFFYLLSGAMTGSFCSSYVIVTLFGAYALYSQIGDSSCDPSGGIPFNESCAVTAQEVMAALVGVLFAAMGVAQLGTSTESLSIARVAAHEALTAIRRKPGAECEILYCSTMEMSTHSSASSTLMVNVGASATSIGSSQMNPKPEGPLSLVRSNSMLAASSLIPALALAASLGSNIQIIHSMSYEIETVYKSHSEEEIVSTTEIEPIMESDESAEETSEQGVKEVDSGSDGDATLATIPTNKIKSLDIEVGTITKAIKAILPKYEIDVSSTLGLKPTEINGAIAMNNVHFSYPTRPNLKILNGLTVDIKPGETVAFVGPSGGGKSTIAALLERFYDPSDGCVTLDGIDLRELNVAHLRGLIGYVGQEPTLFATSIRNNIQYGNPDATQEQIENAARMANAHDFIESFSDG
jgi:ABC-type multidrug transport system fused ATPase/permease subunit